MYVATQRYIHQDHLTGTSVTSDSGGAQTSTLKYRPYGSLRSSTGTIPTDKRFTGQHWDAHPVALYYWARYYEPSIGRFISADTIVPGGLTCTAPGQTCLPSGPRRCA